MTEILTSILSGLGIVLLITLELAVLMGIIMFCVYTWRLLRG